jgi:hypothetical protein
MATSADSTLEPPLELRLSSKAKAKLAYRAAILGKDEATVAQDLIEETLASSVTQQLTYDQRLTLWRNWISSHPLQPFLADDSRASIYQ